MRAWPGGIAPKREDEPMRRLVGTASAAALMAALMVVVPAPIARAAMPGANGRIAFDHLPPGGITHGVVSIAVDGTGSTRLTSTTTSPWPSWSPDGSRIAFTSSRDGNDEIYVMNADGSALTRLTNNSATDIEPAWSPDGSRIAFVRGSGPSSELYVMNADGSGQTRVLSGGPIRSPNWAPNGARIALGCGVGAGSNTDLCLVNTDGSGLVRLATACCINVYPSWSPDGKRIAFMSNRDGTSESNYEIYVVNADGTAVTRLTNNPNVDSGPAWSPDGSRIVFSSDRDGPFDLYTMNPDGTGLTRLTVKADASHPEWQPVPRVAVPASGGAASSPYPSTLDVSRMRGLVSDVDVTLTGLSHARSQDLDVVLVGPGGQAVTLLSDSADGSVAGASLTFDDEAPSVLPAVGSGGRLAPGPWQVTNYGSGDPMPGPAPSPAPYGNRLDVFDGTSPVGTWTLYVADDTIGGGGVIAGWSLAITTAPIVIRNGATPTPAAPYPATVSVSGLAGSVTDVDVTLTGLSAPRGQDLDVVVVDPRGDAVTVLSDTSRGPVDGATIVFDDAARSPFQASDPITSGVFQVTNYEQDDPMPAPAPDPAPYGRRLDTFSGIDPDGTWSLYVVDDDGAGGTGSIDAWSLQITTDAVSTSVTFRSTGRALTSPQPGAALHAALARVLGSFVGLFAHTLANLLTT